MGTDIIRFTYRKQDIILECGEFKTINGKEVSWYEDVLLALFPDITWEFEMDDEYQGDWFAVGYDKDKNWYYKSGAFGSCSCCDWYQSLSGENDCKEFIDDMLCIVKIPIDVIEYLGNEKKNYWKACSSPLDKLIEFVQGIKNE